MEQVTQSPYVIPHKGKLIIKLLINERPVTIGTIEHRTLKKRINSVNHIFHKTQSIGFNYDMLMADYFDNVEITVGDNVYRTTKETILEFGEEKTYDGFEKQIFLRLTYFTTN